MSAAAEKLIKRFTDKGRTVEEAKDMAIEAIEIVVRELMTQPEQINLQKTWSDLQLLKKEIKEL